MLLSIYEENHCLLDESKSGGGGAVKGGERGTKSVQRYSVVKSIRNDCVEHEILLADNFLGASRAHRS